MADALGDRDLAYAEKKPEAWLKVRFPFAQQWREAFEASIIQWRRICHTNERDLPDDDLSDMAMLLLAADPPPDVRPADLIDDLDLQGQDFEAHGFPKIGLADWRGRQITGQIGGRIPSTWFSLEHTSLYGQKVCEGFSGAPVWVRGRSAVAGIINEFVSDTELNTFNGVMISIRALKQFDDAIAATFRLGQETLGEVFGAPGYPTHYVERTALLARLRDRILGREGTVAVSGERGLGLHGMGGIGKTVLSVALVRDRKVRRAFPDGIFWITVGQNIDAASLQAQLHYRITGHSLAATAIETGREALGEALEHKRVLIILDDVWQPRIAQAFPPPSEGSKLLITTRIREVIERFSAVEVQVHVAKDCEARTLLEQYAGDAFPREPAQLDMLDDILKETGKLPLALALVGTMARRAGADFWPDILKRLKDARLDWITASIPDYKTYESLLKSLEASVTTLGVAERERYTELGVFAEDTPVPMGVLEVLWGAGTADRLEVWELANTFVARALASWTTDGHLALHDLQRDYIRATTTDLPRLHGRLVDAYRSRCSAGWASGPDDGYFFQFLPHHLDATGQHNELTSLLVDYAWIEAKLKATDVRSVLSDYDLVTNEPDLRLVQRAIFLSIPALSRDPIYLPSQLIGRLRKIKEHRVQALIKKALFGPGSPWLQPLTTSLVSPTTPLLQTLRGHLDHVTSAMLTPDCRIAVSGAWDTARIWNLHEGVAKHILKLRGISAVALTRNGHTVLLGDSSGHVKVWDVELATAKYAFRGHDGRVNAVAISDHGNIGVSCSRKINVWDLSNGSSRHILEGHTSTVTSLAISVDGGLGLSGSEDNTVRVWDLEAGCLKYVFLGHVDTISAIAVAPDGCLAISGSKDGVIRLWDVKKHMLLRAIDGHETSITAVSMSAAGNTFFSGDEHGIVKEWNLRDDTPSNTFILECGRVIWIAADARKSLCVPGIDYTLRLVDLDRVHRPQARLWLKRIARQSRCLFAQRSLPATAEPNLSPLKQQSISSIAVSRGKYSISGSMDGDLRVWDVEKAALYNTVKGHTGKVTGIALSADGRTAVSGGADRSIRAWRIPSAKRLLTLQDVNKDDEFSYFQRPVSAVAITDDGKRALSGTTDGGLTMWDLERGLKITHFDNIVDEISSIKVSDDGLVAILGSHDGTVCVLDLKAGTVNGTLTGHEGRVNAVAITPDGRVGVSASEDKTIRVWNLSTNSVTYILSGHKEEVTSVALDTKGRFAVSAACSYFDKVGVGDIGIRDAMLSVKAVTHFRTCEPDIGTGERGFFGQKDYVVCVWDIRSGVLHKQLIGHEGWIWSVALSPDCDHIISGSQDCTVRVWGIEDGRLIATFYGDDEITCVAAGKAGLFLAGSQNGAVHILRLEQ